MYKMCPRTRLGFNYEKAGLLNSDLLVRENIDDLVDLETPATRRREASGDTPHEEKIDGSAFYHGGVRVRRNYSGGA